MPGRSEAGLRTRAIWLLALIVGLICLVLAWRWTSLSAWLDADQLVARLRQSGTGLGPLAAIAYVALASVLAIPLGVIIIVSALAFGPWFGIVYAITGSCIGAAINYMVGRYLGHEALRRIGGARINRLSTRLAKRGVLSVVIVRMLPIAPFAVVNLVAGATHIQFLDFLVGTFLGMIPGGVILAFFADQIGSIVLGGG